MRRRTLLAAAAAAAAGSGCTGDGEDPGRNPPAGTFLLHNVRVFDGERVADADSVRVEAGLVAAVGAGLPAPDGMATYDGAGATVLPGLIDGHVHAFPTAALPDALRFGVTTVLDMFSDPSWLADAREARGSVAETDRADAWGAGLLVTAPGGHGTQFGLDIPTLAPGDDAASFVGHRLAEGSDYIKIVMEDNRVYPGGSVPSLTDEQVRAVVDAAHERDALAVVHVSTLTDAVTAARAGADALMHMPHDDRLGDSEVDTLAAAGVPVFATMSVISALACGPHAEALRDDPRVASLLTADQVSGLEGTFGFCAAELLDYALANVAALHEAGVPVLAGTDAPNPGTAFGASMLAELGLLVEAGLTPLAALTAATAGPADAFGLADRGRIAPGQRADLVLVEGDPTEDIDAIFDLTAIWKNGHPVEREPG